MKDKLVGSKVAWVADGYPGQSKRISSASCTPARRKLLCSVCRAEHEENQNTETSYEKTPRRVKSASYLQKKRVSIEEDLDECFKPFNKKSYRPQSAKTVYSQNSSTEYPRRRVKSAGSARHPSELVKSYSLISRAYVELKYQDSIQAAPSQNYLDRHARCLDHTHIHTQLLQDRPRAACENCGVLCYDAFRPSSAPSRRTTPGQENYINYLRPNTALIWVPYNISIL